MKKSYYKSYYICKKHPYRNAFYMRSGGPANSVDTVYSVHDNEAEAEEMLHKLDYHRLCAYISKLCSFDMDVEDDISVHAVGAYTEGGYTRLIHWRIHQPEDLVWLAEQCPNSQIRIILVSPDGGTLGVDVWESNIIQAGGSLSRQ